MESGANALSAPRSTIRPTRLGRVGLAALQTARHSSPGLLYSPRHHDASRRGRSSQRQEQRQNDSQETPSETAGFLEFGPLSL